MFVFGGAMNVDDEQRASLARRRGRLFAGPVERRVPLFGVCLGGQLLAKAAGAHVGPSPVPEDAIHAGRADSGRPGGSGLRAPAAALRRAHLHRYAFDVPPGAVELARSERVAQALRVGECAWGVQFHPEVRLGQVESWLTSEIGHRSPEEVQRLRREFADGIGAWSDLGADLCRAFLETAESLAPARYSAR